MNRPDSDRARLRLAITTCFSVAVIVSSFLWLPFSLGLMAGWVACMLVDAYDPRTGRGDA